jgi:hypothetical protein
MAVDVECLHRLGWFSIVLGEQVERTDDGRTQGVLKGPAVSRLAPVLAKDQDVTAVDLTVNKAVPMDLAESKRKCKCKPEPIFERWRSTIGIMKGL